MYRLPPLGKDSTLVITDYLKAISLSNSLKNKTTDDRIIVNLGLTDDDNSLPTVKLPILTKDTLGNPLVIVDLRGYKKRKITGDQIIDVIYPSTDVEGILLSAKLLAKYNGPETYRDIKLSYLKSLTMFVYEQISRILLLNNLDKNTILASIGAFVMNSIDRDTSIEAMVHVLSKEKLILEDSNTLLEKISLVKNYPNNVDGFIDYLKRVDETGKLDRFNVELYRITMAGTTMGDVNKLLMNTIIFNPVSWITLVKLHHKNSYLKKTILASNLMTFKRFTGYDEIATFVDKTIK